MWKALAASLAVFAALPAWAEPPKVAVSIAPLHSLVALVMKGVGTPDLIVPANASPHDFALRPSDARMLSQADLVVMADKGLEGFLAKPLKTLAADAGVMEMSALPGMTLLPRREGGVWEDDEHGHDHEDEHDPHLWLDVGNAMVLVKAVAERLATMDPANRATYQANAQAVLPALDGLDVSLREDKLKAVKDVPYVVFHDAYQYLEHRYGLNPVGAVVVDPERPPSARRLAQLRDRLKRAEVTCVFREPQFSAATAERLAESAGARVAVLDPVGGDYVAMMGRLGTSLSQCLSGR